MGAALYLTKFFCHLCCLFQNPKEQAKSCRVHLFNRWVDQTMCLFILSAIILFQKMLMKSSCNVKSKYRTYCKGYQLLSTTCCCLLPQIPHKWKPWRTNKSSILKEITEINFYCLNLFTPKISLVILPTVFHAVLVKLI